MKTLLQHSIWGVGAIPLEEWKYRNLKRVLFPSFDVIMILSGVSAILVGVPTLDFFFNPTIVKVFVFLFTLASILALLGGIFPARWRSEIIGVTATLGLVVTYLLALIFRTITDDISRMFGSFFVSGIVAIIIFRLSLVSAEWQQRRSPHD